MTKYRGISTLGIMLLAFCGALASNFPLYDFYEFRPASGTNPAQCVIHSVPYTDCSPTINQVICTILVDEEIVRLRENNIVANQCGPELFRHL